MVTYTFTNGTSADATEVNQNFTDVEDGYADADGFIYTDNTNYTSTSTSYETIRTYTFNKSIDGFWIYIELSTNNSSGTSRLQLVKNGTPINIQDEAHFSGAEAGDIGISSTDYVSNVAVSGGTSYWPESGAWLYFDISMVATDTLDIDIKTNNVSYTSKLHKHAIIGVKNKSTDTTWVSVS